VQYVKGNEDPTLGGFLEQIALYSDTDNLNGDDCVSLMTVHNAKGLEYKNVFLVGLEEEIFPNKKSADEEDGIEEERRVAYVGMTRAKERLYLTLANQRTLYGLTHRNCQSRFINEVGNELLNKQFNGNKDSNKRVNKTPTAFQSFTLQQQIAKNKAQEKVDSTPNNILFSEGDTVLHTIFGTGTVLQVTNTGGDCMLRVDFAKVGIKTIMTNYTKIKKIG
jgi:DNA helicase-2/ATP-dependent DNA helicase PcrA